MVLSYKGGKVGSSHEYSNLAHFETKQLTDNSVLTATIEIEPLQDYAIVIDGVRGTIKGLEDEESSTAVEFIVSVDENQNVLDPDDEDTIFHGVFMKDRTTTGISMIDASTQYIFNRGIPTDSRALRLVCTSDNAELSATDLNVVVEYHYEKYNAGMRLQRGL
jgi:hypothetical protein